MIFEYFNFFNIEIYLIDKLEIPSVYTS